MKSKKRNIILLLTIILFGIYLALVFSYNNGYYEYKSYNKMMLTKESMEQFEKDIDEGKDINVYNYLSTNYKDYSNSLTNAGVKIGEASEKFITKGVGEFINVLSKFFAN